MSKVCMVILIIIHIVGAGSVRHFDVPNDDRFDKVCKALLNVESGNQHYKMTRHGLWLVKSHKGAIGRWQVMPDTVGWFNMLTKRNIKVWQLKNPIENEMVGRWYFTWLYYVKFPSNESRAISAYNMGHNNRLINKNYIKRVMEQL